MKTGRLLCHWLGSPALPCEDLLFHNVNQDPKTRKAPLYIHADKPVNAGTASISPMNIKRKPRKVK